MDGWFDEVHRYVCHACTAKNGTERSFPVVATSRDFTASPLPPFDLHGTTSAPVDKPPNSKPPIDSTMTGGDQ